MTEKDIIGGIAVAAAMIGQGSYLWQVLRRTVKPHIFSWFIWGLLGIIGAAAQYADNAGPGSWSLIISSIVCFFISIAGFFNGERSVTRGDWICFIFSLSAIPAWLVTKDPMWASVIVATIDVIAFYPTFRKAWNHPHDEGITAFATYAFQMAVAFFALDNYTVTTMAYPVALFIMNASTSALLLYRRRIIPA